LSDLKASKNPLDMNQKAFESLSKILFCPDCSGELLYKKSSYTCSDCKRKYPVHGKIVAVLPSNLEESKLNEDEYYESHRMEGKNKPAWMTLAFKREDMQFLSNDFLPKHGNKIKGRFLEIGSGSCWASSIIQKSFQSKLDLVIASDVSQAALEKGEMISRSMGANINYFFNVDSERMPFKDDSFEVIFGSAIIHHFSNTKKGLSEIHRILTKGGVYLGINETVTGSIFTKFSRSRLWHVQERAKDRGITEKVFSWKEWTDLFSGAGFENVCIDLERNSEYKLRSSARTYTRWVMPLYYQLISVFPEVVVRNYLASSISILARK